MHKRHGSRQKTKEPVTEPDPIPDEVILPRTDIISEPEPEIDLELLLALGNAYEEMPVYGPDIHNKLAERWLPILKKGLASDTKEKLLKEYTIPANCKLLKAPTLNPEISAAVADIVKSRDHKLQVEQDQLGLGITAINRAMTSLLTKDDKVSTIKFLSDSCRILSDLHYIETQVRTKLISRELDKSFLAVIQKQDRDETLFGNSLSEQIKASKVIERQGLLIKKPLPQKPPAASIIPSTSTTPPGKLARPLSLSVIEQRGAGDIVQGPVSPHTSSNVTSSSSDSTDAPSELDHQQQTCPTTALTQLPHIPTQSDYPGFSGALKTAFIARGIPIQSLELVIASISKSTSQKYNSTYKLWWEFCHINRIDPFTGSISSIMIFLSELFNKGISHGTLNCHRSALSLLIGSDVVNSEQVKRLLKGAYILRPKARK